MAVWSELPHHLLGLVFHHLSYPDLIRSHAICKSWLIALKSMDMPIKTHSPMLLLDGGDEVDDEGEFRTVFSLAEKKSYRLYLPQIRGCRILASAGGWLVTIDDAAELHLFNPFTLVEHALPPISTLPVIQGVKRDGCITGYMYDRTLEDRQFYFRDLEYMRACFYKRALIFHHQSSSSEIVVFIFCGDLRYLAFARVGEECWTGVEKMPPYSCFSDVILHKGRYYGVTVHGSFIAFDIFSCSSTKVIRKGPGYVIDTIFRHYLAETFDGDSLMHIWRHDTLTPLGEEGVGYSLFGVYNTRSFTVFLLDDMNKNEMIKVERLEQGTALLLGRNRSMLLRTRDLPELRENCIYFTDGGIPHHHRWRVAFFDMTTGIVEPLYPSGFILNSRARLPPAWLLSLCQY